MKDTSVFGRTGVVSASNNDYTWTQINKATSSIADITTRSHTVLTDIGTYNHATIDTHMTSGTGIHGVTGYVVGTSDGQTLTNKTLTTPTIGDFTNSNHTHTATGATGGIIDHVNLNNKGTNTHSQIDTALTASTSHIAANGTFVHGLGTTSTQSAGSATITGGSISGITDLAVVDGGTGASTAPTVLSNLGRRPLIPRVDTITSSTTPTPNANTTDQYTVTALAAGATFGAPSGIPNDGQKLTIRIKDNATARALSWNAIYRAGTDIALPTTTVTSKTTYIGFIYNSADSKWDLVAYMGNI